MTTGRRLQEYQSRQRSLKYKAVEAAPDAPTNLNQSSAFQVTSTGVHVDAQAQLYIASKPPLRAVSLPVPASAANYNSRRALLDAKLLTSASAHSVPAQKPCVCSPVEITGTAVRAHHDGAGRVSETIGAGSSGGVVPVASQRPRLGSELGAAAPWQSPGLVALKIEDKMSRELRSSDRSELDGL